jgi:ribonuclease HII
MALKSFDLLRSFGYLINMIGIDEVGRGCLAGPLLVVAARANKQLPKGVTDSKLLSKIQRENLYKELIRCCEFGEGWVKASEIDRLGLTAATKLGVKRALRELKSNNQDELIIDGNINYAPKSYKKIQVLIDGDLIVPIISAASIYAKVTRDIYMTSLAKRHPKYSFETNVGYGTASHLEAIDAFGLIKNLHRISFSPVRLYQQKLEV